ncbi:Muscle-specific protein 20 [Podochytrium sp. JEL0797]|nr:Muscle-specific protein 20 [Podochytrium sp. JEL0797]
MIADEDDEPQLYGLDKELAEKAAAKHSPQREQEARQYIETVSGMRLAHESFHESLKDGVVLCHMMNRILPQNQIKVGMSKMPFKQMENIGEFLARVELLGVPAHERFMTVDLFEAKNMNQVTNCIFSLSRHAAKAGFQGPVLGPKLTDKNERVFSEEQLREARAMPSKLMSYSSNVSSGLSFGGRREIGERVQVERKGSGEERGVVAGAPVVAAERVVVAQGPVYSQPVFEAPTAPAQQQYVSQQQYQPQQPQPQQQQQQQQHQHQQQQPQQQQFIPPPRRTHTIPSPTATSVDSITANVATLSARDPSPSSRGFASSAVPSFASTTPPSFAAPSLGRVPSSERNFSERNALERNAPERNQPSSPPQSTRRPSMRTHTTSASTTTPPSMSSAPPPTTTPTSTIPTPIAKESLAPIPRASGSLSITQFRTYAEYKAAKAALEAAAAETGGGGVAPSVATVPVTAMGSARQRAYSRDRGQVQGREGEGQQQPQQQSRGYTPRSRSTSRRVEIVREYKKAVTDDDEEVVVEEGWN